MFESHYPDNGRKDGRVIYCIGLENRHTFIGIGGLNPSPSAIFLLSSLKTLLNEKERRSIMVSTEDFDSSSPCSNQGVSAFLF